MKRICLIMTIWLIFPTGGFAQKSISDLSEDHADALQKYLDQHPRLRFLSETSYDQEYLKGIREDFGSPFTPFYQRGDFNRDGKQDFAVILAQNVPPKRNPDLAESHQLEYELMIVIFNGARNGTYKMAFSQSVLAPLVCSISLTRDKKRHLFFRVYETDYIFTMIPKGNGYRVKG